MASKVIGFRVPEDMAEELEKVSEERGMTVAKFMRSLVDETLYPATENKGQKNGDSVTLEQLESLANEHKDLVDQVESLYLLMNHIGVKIAKYETEGILGPKQVETMQDVETLKSKIGAYEDKFVLISQNSKNSLDRVSYLYEHKESSDRAYEELRNEVNQLRSKLETVTVLPLKIKQLESDMTHMTTNLPSTIRGILRQPTDETHTITLKSGREHTLRVYKSPAGLVKPHVVVRDPISGNKYVDLGEPLN